MSNLLNVRRVQIQEIDCGGHPIGKPSFGVLANDDYEQQFADGYETLDKLNEAIEDAGSILDVVGGFDTISREGIGVDNFFGSPPVELR